MCSYSYSMIELAVQTSPRPGLWNFACRQEDPKPYEAETECYVQSWL